MSDIDSDRRMHETFSTRVDRNLAEWELPKRFPLTSGDDSQAKLASGEAGKPAVVRSGHELAEFDQCFRQQAKLVEDAVNKITKQEVEAVSALYSQTAS